ncbi:predicted protein [Plenodomus lingam JN3]|uniref:Predicted protein n=1 Tax=Leptosphaeria maculans (strain JN3 / isolate v23.1.3 / race Av1-4-5-6-7-8) TaxID=985895 RepID=E4ZTX4_LEPMJ|nr:predicted protein [Plenodomus lingam JN3]CBX94684.1 predicted protein [Plenodomus lingam JN3]
MHVVNSAFKVQSQLPNMESLASISASHCFNDPYILSPTHISLSLLAPAQEACTRTGTSATVIHQY